MVLPRLWNITMQLISASMTFSNVRMIDFAVGIETSTSLSPFRPSSSLPPPCCSLLIDLGGLKGRYRLNSPKWSDIFASVIQGSGVGPAS